MMESAKCTSVATSMILPSKVAGGGNTARPMTMAAVKRGSRKRIVGSTLAKIDHKAICTSVARMPAATPAYRAALQVTRYCIGRPLQNDSKDDRRRAPAETHLPNDGIISA